MAHLHPRLTAVALACWWASGACSQPRNTPPESDVSDAGSGANTPPPPGQPEAGLGTLPNAAGADAALGDRPASANAQADVAPVTQSDGPAAGLGFATRITAGFGHTCALNREGQIWCWGANKGGQLGDGTTTLRTTPVAVAGLQQATDVVAGSTITCALDKSGAVLCWGWDTFSTGQMSLTAVPVARVGLAKTLATMDRHMCAITVEGPVLCWGDDFSGQLGSGTIIVGPSPPVTVTGLTGTAKLAVGKAHSCALHFDGSVRCWGLNDTGQLGDGTNVNSPSPVVVRGIAGASDLGAGSLHTCAVASRLVWCWGSNALGQLGRDGTDASTPSQVRGLINAVAVVGGTWHTCALQDNGQVACWGRAIANGTSADASTPTMVAGISDAKAIAAGHQHTCVIGESGQVRCWGHNQDGQLGDGTTVDSTAAVMVKPR